MLSVFPELCEKLVVTAYFRWVFGPVHASKTRPPNGKLSVGNEKGLGIGKIVRNGWNLVFCNDKTHSLCGVLEHISQLSQAFHTNGLRNVPIEANPFGDVSELL